MDLVIPVQEKPAPKRFNEKVYRPGLAWLKANNLSRGPVPKDKDGKATVELHPYWRECLDDLHKRYRGVCAYTSIYIDRVTGARSVDHYIAKSSAVEHAYRWRNFRLACAKINGRKGTFDDLLDPFTIQPQTFVLDLFTGAISTNPALPQPLLDQAQTTITRLGLDDGDCRAMRIEFFDDYRTGAITAAYLKKKCPFVWYEIRRQGM